jgi:hypothetical protein
VRGLDFILKILDFIRGLRGLDFMLRVLDFIQRMRGLGLILRMRGLDLILRSPRKRASRRMKPPHWKIASAVAGIRLR